MADEGPKTDHVPLVSVLMPCYNHEAYVIGSLESVAASDYKLIELIFIDDASKDDSFNLATEWFENNKERFVRIVCIQHEKNRGICATSNELYALSRGEYISFLASDDTLQPDGISRQVNFAIQNNVDFVFTDLGLMDKDGNQISDSAMRHYGKNGRKLAASRFCLLVDIIFNWGAPWNKTFMSSALVKKIGLYDANLLFEDRDFIMRVLINGSFALMPEAPMTYRIRLNGMFTPGLKHDEVLCDFRKADRKNYLNASGVIKLLLGIRVYSDRDKYREVGITNAMVVWLAIRVFDRLKRLILKIHKVLMWQ